MQSQMKSLINQAVAARAAESASLGVPLNQEMRQSVKADLRRRIIAQEINTQDIKDYLAETTAQPI